MAKRLKQHLPAYILYPVLATVFIMDVYTKATITLLCISGILFLAMFPLSPIAEWAEKKYGGYESGLLSVCGIPLIPIPFIWLVYMWLEC